MILFTTLSTGLAGLAALSWAMTPKAAGPAEAPAPADHPDAVIRVYGADVWGIRGRFAMHTWIATKAAGADHYRKYQVIGWRLRRDESVVSISRGDPAGDWFGAPPVLLHELRGDRATALVDAVHEAALAYPFAREYVMWPGPNSNSFTEWVARQVPELELRLPMKALGRNWMRDYLAASRSSMN